jgi:hypothetical protein
VPPDGRRADRPNFGAVSNARVRDLTPDQPVDFLKEARCVKRFQPEEPPPVITPVTCPFCGAGTIKAASEKVDASSYWRCVACGEMWNLNRMQTAPARWNTWNRR